MISIWPLVVNSRMFWKFRSWPPHNRSNVLLTYVFECRRDFQPFDPFPTNLPEYGCALLVVHH